jgi:pyruvate/2-oxoglutarate dehydrogenase complex dihydrolipoamide dehydrogenase (E3) component
MPQPERFETLVLGSGNGGMYLAWHTARSGRRTAVAERRWIGGSCPNINCLPSKNEIWSAKVADLVHHAASFGAKSGSVVIDMAKVRQRKRDMVKGEVAAVLQQYKSSGAELIMGTGHFVAPKTLEVRLNDGGTRMLVGDQVFVNIGTRATIPSVPGLDAAGPLTNIEALELDYVPQHLIVLGGGVCRPRNGTGISSLRQPRYDHRAWSSARWPGGSGRRGRDAADPQCRRN